MCTLPPTGLLSSPKEKNTCPRFDVIKGSEGTHPTLKYVDATPSPYLVEA